MKDRQGIGGNFSGKLTQRLEAYTDPNCAVIDVEDCLHYLRSTYREYSRLKEGPFRVHVTRAVTAISQRRAQQQQSADVLSAQPESTVPEASMNRTLAAMYSTGGRTMDVANGREHCSNAPARQASGEEFDMAIDDKEQPVSSRRAVTAADPLRGPEPSPPPPPPAPAPAAAALPSRPGADVRGSGGAPQSKRQRTGSARRSNTSGSSAVTPLPITYADLAGIEDVLDQVRELVEYPLKHPEVYEWLGVDPPRGILLHGPPGCGKTALANAIANECGVPFLRIAAPEIVSGMSGESEAKIRSLFQEAATLAPCIVFFDEIDSIAPKRETAQREMERRIVAQMLTCLDDLAGLGTAVPPPTGRDARDEGNGGATPGAITGAVSLAHKHVVVIGATNRADALDPALRRAGRFDREIALGIPSESSRERILRVLARRLRLSGDFDFTELAHKTPGFVGADLAALVKEAAAEAVKRIFKDLNRDNDNTNNVASFQSLELAETSETIGETGHVGLAAAAAAFPPTADQERQEGAAASALATGRFGGGPLEARELAGLAIKMRDFQEALPKVQPSVRREGFTTTPDVTWDDVGALADVREELAFAITKPIAQPRLFEAMGLRSATGVLLFGPPGCGKTLVAKAAANESGANFMSIKGPELLNKYVGESERAVRQLFARARAASPCVLFFDEMDALAPRRGSDAANASAERLVNQLLTEMDGIDGRQGVYLIAATNRPDIIDPALLRPGRLDKMLYVPLPPPEGRVAILEALTRRTPLADDVDLVTIGKSARLDGFSGADLAALVREACVTALKDSLEASASTMNDATLACAVTTQHFERASRMIQPSVSAKDKRMYDALRLKLRSSRGHLKGDEEGFKEAGVPE